MKSLNTMQPHISRQEALVTRAQRESLQKNKGAVIWFTGLSGSGKTTLAHGLEARLHTMGCRTFVLDGDNVRHGLCRDLGFTLSDRQENIRRIGEVSKLFYEAGIIVLTALISPLALDRNNARALLPKERFIEVYCNSALEVCEERDTKGLYQKARTGTLKEFTGISSPYEPPSTPELELDTANASIDVCIDSLIRHLQQRVIIAAN